MPLLAREIDCFPPDLFESPDLNRRTEGTGWWVAYTRSRREKDLMRRLVATNTSFYCPIISKRTRAPSGRIRESFVPLFPGYVFLYGNEDDRLTALTTNCVSWINPVADPIQLTRELAQVRRLIASNLPITPEERVETGIAVRVLTGPLRGHEGVVIERRGKRRLLVSVDLLQQGASVDLDECDVQPF
ncbi:MAG: antitermination protein NusG [Planctomycetota bacterium]|nr:antitermination protein NusG [Planctomycetaceae bacterium]MDQ3329946.1 antitermination protein NusG [Planctomycetota bacterium]